MLFALKEGRGLTAVWRSFLFCFSFTSIFEALNLLGSPGKLLLLFFLLRIYFSVPSLRFSCVSIYINGIDYLFLLDYLVHPSTHGVTSTLTHSDTDLSRLTFFFSCCILNFEPAFNSCEGGDVDTAVTVAYTLSCLASLC